MALAQEWDNVGLIAGDTDAAVRRVLLCIDLTAAVVDEALARKVDLVMAYHPPLFQPITRLLSHGRDTDAHVFRCIAGGVAIYSMHTALDAADGGTNDVLAQRCGIAETSPIEYTAISPAACKVVVFVPAESAQCLADIAKRPRKFRMHSVAVYSLAHLEALRLVAERLFVPSEIGESGSDIAESASNIVVIVVAGWYSVREGKRAFVGYNTLIEEQRDDAEMITLLSNGKTTAIAVLMLMAAVSFIGLVIFALAVLDVTSFLAGTRDSLMGRGWLQAIVWSSLFGVSAL
ncbi:MAG: Nif3-like dinuclear metal center hexameric protein, partial [Planctomycetes bacterium]|nr:Nif3-like dinuclear metal center hexameric protein [Planctomycetota bacterium]